MVQEFKWIALSLATIWVVALCVPSVRDSYEWLEMPAATRVVLEVARRLCSRVRPFPAAGLLFASVEDRASSGVAPLIARMPLDYRQIALDSILPAAELLAAALNCLVATFPVSIVCGLLFLANYRGLTGELGYALLRRYRIWGWLWLGLLAACASASLLKPLTILTLPELARILSFHELLLVCSVVNGLSFAFEYLLGTCLQVYLLLIAYGWVRGSSFSPCSCAAICRPSHGFRSQVGTGYRSCDGRARSFASLLEAWLTGRSDWLEDLDPRGNNLSSNACSHHALDGHRADPVGPSQRLSSRRGRSAWTLPKGMD